jgi:thioredoxin reductase (NADPH)
MTKSILMLVTDHAPEFEQISRELIKRYGSDYQVVHEFSPESALQRLEQAAETIAIVLAALHLSQMAGIDFLEQAHERQPRAKRVLLIPHGNRSASKPILRAISLGRFDRYTTVPSQFPDEQFHSLITDLLRDWQRQQQSPTPVVTLIGERWDARAYELRDLLHRGGLPFDFLTVDSSEAAALLQRIKHPEGPFPVLVRFDGQVLANPSNEELAQALGVRHSSEEGVFDLVVVGAGPAGLSAAVYGASEGLHTMVIDRDSIGGQAGTSALIRNYLGFPFGISGADLTNRALDQAWGFGAESSVMRPAVALRVEGNNRILVLADGSEIMSRTIVLATGAHYQRLGIASLEALVGSGVFYGGGVTEAPALEGQSVFVVGAGNSAGQAALNLAKYARQVTMLVRGSSLESTMSDYLVKEIGTAENIAVRLRTVIVDGSGAQRLEHLILKDLNTDATETVAAAALFVLIGAQPHTDWLPTSIQRDPKGFILTDSDLAMETTTEGLERTQPPLLLETSIPGVFAAGDVRHGSVKRVAAAVGEGGIAIQSVHRYLARLKA